MSCIARVWGSPCCEAVVVLSLGITSVITGYLGRRLPTLRKSIQGIGALLSGRLQETLTGIRTVQPLKNKRHELTRLDEANRGILQREVQQWGIQVWGRIELIDW